MLQVAHSPPRGAHAAGVQPPEPIAQALEFLRGPAWVLSDDTRVVACNRAARQLLARTQVLVQDPGVLRCTGGRDMRRLAQLLCACFQEMAVPGPAATRGRVRMLQLGAADGTRLFLFVAPWPDPDRRLAVVSCFDPAWHGDQPDPAVLSACFGFTPSEARVAAAVATGLVPKDIATRHGTTLATVRTQLHCALAKAGVTRQGDLARLVQSIPASHRGAD